MTKLVKKEGEFTVSCLFSFTSTVFTLRTIRKCNYRYLELSVCVNLSRSWETSGRTLHPPAQLDHRRMTVSKVYRSVLVWVEGWSCWQLCVFFSVSLASYHHRTGEPFLKTLLLDVLTMVFYGDVFLFSARAPTGTLYPSVPLQRAEIMEKRVKTTLSYFRQKQGKQEVQQMGALITSH